MADSLKIVHQGHPTLQQTARDIQYLDDPQLQKLIDHLITTVQEANGVGIAAPQVAASLRLFIVASRPNSRYPYAPQMPPTAMLNPRIVAHSQETVKDWEGCLSVPGVRGLVPRYREIEVEYCDRAGNLQRQVLTDFIARIFQHELDHLDGILFIDRLQSHEDRFTEEEYQNSLAQSR
ncbi:peptide deformylase [Spirulina sp. CS-785/01]|uniref:peptide deformylase n=1 Tax=Spirulina sp. CS-785/01 TaxID=3021716 RepID=UPI00232B78E1|nr:peptide deformylase [Spirulina sp. CS-785/01]MDB9313756.1 peptide deformylase [Spirulina sp. CS-785/01]